MREKSSGGFQRDTHCQSIEITNAQRSDSYDSLAEQAAAALNLKPLPCSSLCLFKPKGGVKVSCDDLVLNQVSRHWTLGNYLLLLKKSPSSIQIGVAHVIYDSVESDQYSSGLVSYTFS